MRCEAAAGCGWHGVTAAANGRWRAGTVAASVRGGPTAGVRGCSWRGVHGCRWRGVRGVRVRKTK